MDQTLLSIIVPIYKEKKNLNKFLEKCKKTNTKKIEFIFILDYYFRENINDIWIFKKEKNINATIILNTKRQGRTQSIKSAFKNANGKYSLILSIDSSFSKEFNDEIKKLESINSDIVEFSLKVKEPLKISYNLRKKFSKEINLTESPEPYAFINSIDFNKFFKTSLLSDKRTALKTTSLNSRFSLEILILALFFAKTYSIIPKKLISTKIKTFKNFNPLKIIKQWGEIKNLINKEKPNLIIEFNYNYSFSNSVIAYSVVKHLRNKILTKKFKEKFDNLLENKHFLETNKYILENKKEQEKIKESLRKIKK